ncbi:MAG: hypothetical protein C0490_02680 [Marivirga sp.]|nr:hypothetical protein [Marivirga sp.]
MKLARSIMLLFATPFILIGCSGELQTASNTEKGAILNNNKTYACIAPHDPDGKSRADDKAYGGLMLPESYDEGILSIEMFNCNPKKILCRGVGNETTNGKI